MEAGDRTTPLTTAAGAPEEARGVESDEAVSSEVAASMLGVSVPYLTELLDIEAIPCRCVDDQRLIRVVDLNAYRERRDRARAGMRKMADIINESAGGWTY